MVKLLSVITIFTAPVFIFSTIVKIKAFFAGRKGAPFFQPYYDMVKLFRKQMTVSRITGLIFIFGTLVTLSSTIMVLLFIPIAGNESFLSFKGDIIFVAYMLALGRFFMILSAFDTGSSFEGMGGAREATFSMLSEPALFLALMAVTGKTGDVSFGKSFSQLSPLVWQAVGIGFLLMAVAFFIIILVENSRIPIDDPNTHLELTMIHEVMILDHSGPLLGIMEVSALLKMFAFISILSHIVFPFNFGSAWLNFLVYYLGILGIAVLIGVIESSMARVKLKKIPTFQIIVIVFAGIGMFLSLE